MNEQLTEKQAADVLAANRLGFTTHVMGVTNSPEKAAELLKQATTRAAQETATYEKRAKLSETILASLKSEPSSSPSLRRYLKRVPPLLFMVNPIFSKALKDYLGRTGKDTRQLVAALDHRWSYPTVRRWLTETGGASHKVIREVCAILMLDPKPIISGNLTSGDSGLLSLDAINARYESLRKSEARTLFEVVNLASVFCFNIAVREGLSATFAINEKFQGIISPITPQGAGLTIRVEGGNVCLMIAVVTNSNTATSNNPLNEVTLENALKELFK